MHFSLLFLLLLLSLHFIEKQLKNEQIKNNTNPQNLDFLNKKPTHVSKNSKKPLKKMQLKSSIFE
jgi:hypothetical protein